MMMVIVMMINNSTNKYYVMSNGTTFATATEPSMKNAELMLFVRSTVRDTSAITIEAPAFFRSDSIEIAVALEEDGTASLMRVFS